MITCTLRETAISSSRDDSQLCVYFSGDCDLVKPIGRRGSGDANDHTPPLAAAIALACNWDWMCG